MPPRAYALSRDGELRPRPTGGPRLLTALLLLSLPTTLAAQARVQFEGQVVDASSGQVIPNAIVRLGDHGTVLTSEQGRFRFDGVEPGEYTVLVEALGYAGIEISVSVVTDLSVSLPLEPAPLPLDSIVVEVGTIDFDGRVRDPRLDANLHDAHVRSDQGHDQWTNWHGRFDLDDVFERVPLRVIITGFGYLPLDTTFIPDHEERYAFNLMPDPLGQRMIEIQTQRLADRARAGRRYRPFRLQPELGREEMARFMSRGSLQNLLERTYPISVLRRVSCFLIDERPTYSRTERTHVLQTTLPQQLERIELLEFPGQRGALMLRVYTRRFFQELIATNRSLRTPVMVNFTRTCQ